MYVKFFNQRGELVFGKNGSEVSPFRLTGAEGLSIPDKSLNTAIYTNYRGQETLGTHICSRTITMSGDVLINKNTPHILSEAARILDTEGILEIHFDDKKPRRINCVCQSFVPGEKKGRYALFVMQFVCDDPYFYDADMTSVSAFGVKPLINSSFTFPGIFSERVSRSIVHCFGNAATEPIFKLAVTRENESDSPMISITNHTTGSSIKLIYTAAVGDVITIDTEKRKIYNQSGENLLRFISDDTFFDEFYFVPGENDVEVTVSGSVEAVMVECIYCERYTEAVL